MLWIISVFCTFLNIYIIFLTYYLYCKFFFFLSSKLHLCQFMSWRVFSCCHCRQLLLLYVVHHQCVSWLSHHFHFVFCFSNITSLLITIKKTWSFLYLQLQELSCGEITCNEVTREEQVVVCVNFNVTWTHLVVVVTCKPKLL